MNAHGGNTGLDAVVERYVTPNRRYLKLLHGTVVRMDEEERWALACYWRSSITSACLPSSDPCRGSAGLASARPACPASNSSTARDPA